MTEQEAQNWLIEILGVSRETLAQLNAFREMVIAENAHQNLISAGSITEFWTRHIVDSAQLLCHTLSTKGAWLDLGTGAGFPGMVIAALRVAPITLVESRRKRADFLTRAVESLGLAHVTVAHSSLEALPTGAYTVISARAFAPLPKLLSLALRFSRKDTIWVLPKGKSAREELESLPKTWQGMFHVKPSVTDTNAAILVGQGIELVEKR